MTEWNEYRSLDLEAVAESMRGTAILDTRNLLDPLLAAEHGLVYRGHGRGARPAGDG